MEAKFNEISTSLKQLAIETGRQNMDTQVTRKTLSNLGTPASNKYGLAKSIQARNRQIFKPAPEYPTAVPTKAAEIPGQLFEAIKVFKNMF